MKKRTNEEKRQMIDDACDLINEAGEIIKRAKNCFTCVELNFVEDLMRRKFPSGAHRVAIYKFTLVQKL